MEGPGPTWYCPTETACPTERPRLGTACAAIGDVYCDYGARSGSVAETCANGNWAIANGGCPG
jgi:hypothetical protein